MPRRYAIFLIFVPAYFLSNFFRSTNAVIADDLVRDLSLSPEQLGAMTGVFFVSFSLVQFPLGWALDKFGARLTTGALLLSSVAGALVFAGAESYALLVLGRALIGLGVAAALMGSLKAFSSWFPATEFATVSGVFVALGSLGLVAATAPLQALSEAVGWRQVFGVGAGLALAASLLILLFAKDARAQPTRTKEVGGARDILGNPAFWRIAFLNFCMSGSFYGYQGLWMGPYLSDAQGLSAAQAGTLLLFLSSAAIVGFASSGLLANKLGAVRSLVLSSSLFASLQLVLAFYSGGVVLLSVLMLLFGMTGAFVITVFTHLRQLFAEHLTGRAFAFANFFGFSGVALAQGFLGFVVGHFSSANAGYAPEAFQAIFLLTGLLGLLSVAVYAPFLRSSKLKA